jgi:hypothetical protein
MSFQMFHDRCPDIAFREVRSITIRNNPDYPLLSDEYAFLEMYCNDAGCDCRRVYFSVVAKSNPRCVLAMICWGWESLEFYSKWASFPKSKKDVKMMKGPILAPLSEQSALAPELLKLANNLLLPSPEYVERIKQHYTLFRKTIKEMKGTRGS